MSNPNPVRISAGVPDGGRFAPNGRTEADIDLPTGPSAEDRAQLAAIYADARIASEASARFELGCAKMLAQGVLRQWPDARYLELTESDQGTGSHYAGAVLGSVDPRDELAYLEDEELANGANPEELAMNLSTDGAWMEHTTTQPMSRASGTTYLDLQSAAAIGEPTRPLEQEAVIEPRYRYVDPVSGREVDLLTTTKTSSGRGSRTPVTGWYYADDDELMAGSKPWSGSPTEGQLDLAVRRVNHGSELQA